MDKNIVITGEGIISAIGNDKAAVLQVQHPDDEALVRGSKGIT